jgi:glutaredoxin
MNRRHALIVLLAGMLALPAGAEVYRWTDSTGKVHYIDKPTADAAGLTMYATSWCGYCRRARAYLAEKGIAYREVDIEASEANRREFKAYGGSGVPLFVAGEARLRGFNPSSMEQFLAKTGRR